MSISELKAGEHDYFETKKEALEAVKKITTSHKDVIGGEVLKLSRGHYRTVATYISPLITVGR